MNSQRARALLLMCMLSLLFVSILASATPESPQSVIRGPSERKPLTGGSSAQPSESGNITPLVVSTERITKRWQGYYGNVTGGIVLQDSNGNNLYDWGLVNPSGEIFASNGSSVNWGSIDCVNFTTNTSVLRYNLSEINEFVGLSSDTEQGQEDSVNATFNQTFGDSGGSFTVGSRTFVNADNCSMTTLNQNSAYQSSLFRQILMTDNESIVFAALLEDSQTGYNGQLMDFQIIVGVNGTLEGTTRNYYFFVELS